MLSPWVLEMKPQSCSHTLGELVVSREPGAETPSVRRAGALRLLALGLGVWTPLGREECSVSGVWWLWELHQSITHVSHSPPSTHAGLMFPSQTRSLERAGPAGTQVGKLNSHKGDSSATCWPDPPTWLSEGGASVRTCA